MPLKGSHRDEAFALRFLAISADIRNRLLITFGLLVLYRLAAHMSRCPVSTRAPSRQIWRRAPAAGATLFGLLDLLSGGRSPTSRSWRWGSTRTSPPRSSCRCSCRSSRPCSAAWKRTREGRKWMERGPTILAVPMAALQRVRPDPHLPADRIGGVRTILAAPPGFNLPTLTMIYQHDRRDDVRHLAGRADFRIRHPQPGPVADHLRRHRGAHPGATSAAVLADQQQRVPFAGLHPGADQPDDLRHRLLSRKAAGTSRCMYPGRRVGNRMSMPVKGTLPLMVNMAGMIPLIFAQSLLTLPGDRGAFFVNSPRPRACARSPSACRTPSAAISAGLLDHLLPDGRGFHLLLHGCALRPAELRREPEARRGADPGRDQGRPDTALPDTRLRRITFPGALFLGMVAVLPFWLGCSGRRAAGSSSCW